MSGEEQLRLELEEARAQLRVMQSLLEHAPAVIVHIRRDGSFLFINRVEPGYEAAVQSTTIYDWSDPADHPMIRAAIERVFTTGQQAEYQSHAGASAADRKPFYTRVAPVTRDGAVESVVLIATDITKLKKTEAELQQSQAHLQIVLAATGTGIYWWDVDRKVGGRDEQTARLLGIDSTEEKDSRSLEQFLHPDDAELVRTKIRTAVATGQHYMHEHRIIRADGMVRWVAASARMIKGPYGQRLLGGVRDITERKLREAQMARAHKLESVGRLAGGIAHDFNNMLTVITSNTERVLRKLPEQSPLRADLSAVRQAADRSAALTAQLLTVSRRQLVMPDLVRVDDVVRGIEDLLRSAIGKANQVALSLAASEPVRIDPRQLEQVLTHLASNARDAMPDGGRVTIATTIASVDESLAATIAGARIGRYVKLAFSDTGVGIKSADLEHIFEPFFSTKEQGKGVGLGLATCYGIVAQAEGFMTVSSTPHVGTTFEIFLPIAAR